MSDETTETVRPLSPSERAILERAVRDLETAERTLAAEKRRVEELVALLADGRSAHYEPGAEFLLVREPAGARRKASEVEATAKPTPRPAAAVSSERDSRGEASGDTAVAGPSENGNSG